MNPALQLVKARVRPRFPLGQPTWPTSIDRPPVEKTTGAAYGTAWARTEAARYVRGFLIELVMRPAVAALTAPEIDGLDRIAHLAPPVVFAANHQSHLDTPLLLTSLPERFRHRAAVAAAADYFFEDRVRSALSALAMNAIPIDRSRVSRRSADLSAELIEDGWSFVMCPEGGRSPDGWGQEFRGGAAYLSVRCDVPVVPVHIAGTGRILGKGMTRPKPGRARVTFGTPLRADDGEDTRRFAARLERVVAALADERATDWWMARKRAAAGLTPALTGPDRVGAWRRAWARDDGGEQRRPKRVWP